MTNGNGHVNDKEVIQNNQPKLCPHLNKPCIGDKCAIYSELIQNMSGFQKKFGLCSYNAVVIILSEINQKTTQNQQQKVQIPNIFKT